MFPHLSASFFVIASLCWQHSIAAPNTNRLELSPRENNQKSSFLLSAHENTTLITIQDDFYGLRNVSYFVVSDGLAIIDGDVVYGREKDLLAHRVTNSTQPNHKKARAFSARNTWPGATVSYKYASDAVQTQLSPYVDEAIGRWKSGAPYLTFTRILPNSDSAMNGVVTISANVCGGCNAGIGYRDGDLRMNLQQSCPNYPGYCGSDQATHEFGHVLGLLHEHQRPDREQYVHYHCENLDPICETMPPGATCCSSGLPSECCSTAGNMAIINYPSFDSSGRYDINSIMEYVPDAFALSGTDTLTAAKPGIVVPSFVPPNPDGTDFHRICKMYGTWCPKAQTCYNLGCSSLCLFIPDCTGSPVCTSTRPEICCVGRQSNEDCRKHRALCSEHGCDFLYL